MTILFPMAKIREHLVSLNQLYIVMVFVESSAIQIYAPR